jgi:hypothetical protein
MYAFHAGLLDPEFIFASINFTTFLSTWVVNQVDPKKAHPKTIIQLRLISHYTCPHSTHMVPQVAVTARSANGIPNSS